MHILVRKIIESSSVRKMIEDSREDYNHIVDPNNSGRIYYGCLP